MKLYLRLLWGFFFCGITPVFFARGLVKDYAYLETEERVNGRLFVHKHETLNGLGTDRWSIEGVEVDHAVYEEAFLDAEREELRQTREREEKIQALKEASEKQVRATLARKLLVERVQFCRREISKLEECNLSRFMAFSVETFADAADYNRLVLELLPRAEEALLNESADTQKITQFERDLGDAAGKLELFAQATFNRASKECNDPKVLKRILELC